MILLRRVHAYVGLFIAPSVFFFAFSGGLQLFNLHEAHGSYHPPLIIQTLGNLHKDQVTSEPDEHHGPPPNSPDGDGQPKADHGSHDNDHGSKMSTVVLKWFFEMVAVGLAASTLLGLWIGLSFTRTPRLSWAIFIAGFATPLFIILI